MADYVGGLYWGAPSVETPECLSRSALGFSGLRSFPLRFLGSGKGEREVVWSGRSRVSAPCWHQCLWGSLIVGFIRNLGLHSKPFWDSMGMMSGTFFAGARGGVLILSAVIKP